MRDYIDLVLDLRERVRLESSPPSSLGTLGTLRDRVCRRVRGGGASTVTAVPCDVGVCGATCADVRC